MKVRKLLRIVIDNSTCTEQFPDGYQLSWFCEAYRQYVGKLGFTLHQFHPAGRSLVDYSGLTAPVIDATTSEVRQGQIFVAALGVSN